MSERETKEITTPGGHKVVIKTYLTAREANALKQVIWSQLNLNIEDGKIVATRMAAGGCDLATLAAILRHSSIRLVMRYIHPTAVHQKEAMRRYSETRQENQDRRLN